jgi:nicotinamide mononucleotide (NMN) deamidase PncC
MTLSTDQLVQQIHDAPTRIVLAAAGGGSRAIADLLEVPGASRTLLEAFVPYSDQAMIDYLGSRPDEFCSNRTARAMAMAAFLHARKLLGGTAGASGGTASASGGTASASGGTASALGGTASASGSGDTTVAQAPGATTNFKLVPGLPSSALGATTTAGVACTAGLLTDRPRRGSHRIHVALQTAALTATWSLELLKDRRSRSEEEHVAGRMLLNAVAESCSLENRLTLDLLEGEKVEESRTTALRPWQDLLLGKVEIVSEGGRAFLPATGKTIPANPAILSGAFNPLHVGHRRIAEIGADLLKKPVIMEITILNPDKPPLDYYEIDRRTKQFSPEQPLLLTRAATFDEKARLFPGATFLVGADTLRRIAMDRYYHNDTAACRACLEYISGRGCHFLVFGRDLGTGFMQLADLDLPEVLRSICRDVPPEIFREDISSTGIRKSGAW